MPVLPSLQLRQRPQAMLKGTETRSPTFTNSTSRPASITSPVISCPRTSPLGAVVRPRTMCWSLPQIFVQTIFKMTPCSHLREPKASLGKSIDCTSTFPGPMYAKPRFEAIVLLLLCWIPIERNYGIKKERSGQVCRAGPVFFPEQFADAFTPSCDRIALMQQVAAGDDRRQFLVNKLSAGFAMAVLPVSAQTITTDTDGLEAG